MERSFKLNRVGRITPSAGEGLGWQLEQTADRLADDVPGMAYEASELYRMAADAYEAGAGASIGHSRSRRYYERAEECKRKAGEQDERREEMRRRSRAAEAEREARQEADRQRIRAERAQA